MNIRLLVLGVILMVINVTDAKFSSQLSRIARKATKLGGGGGCGPCAKICSPADGGWGKIPQMAYKSLTNSVNNAKNSMFNGNKLNNCFIKSNSIQGSGFSSTSLNAYSSLSSQSSPIVNSASNNIQHASNYVYEPAQNLAANLYWAD